MSLKINSGSDLSILFSSLNGSNSNNNMANMLGGFSLSDYASIKNGSYGKLVNAYYKKNAADMKSEEADGKEKIYEDKTSKSTTASLTGLKGIASELSQSKSLFEKTTVKGEDGKETEDYDWNALTKKVGEFVKNYNSATDKLMSSTDQSLYNSTLTMVKSTGNSSAMLSRVGITVKGDCTLSFDEDAFKKADMSDIKALFSGSGSYADSISTSASLLESKTAKSSATYGSSGDYHISTPSFFDSYL